MRVETREGAFPLFPEIRRARIFKGGAEAHAGFSDFVSVTVGAVGGDEGSDFLVKGLFRRGLACSMGLFLRVVRPGLRAKSTGEQDKGQQGEPRPEPRGPRADWTL